MTVSHIQRRIQHRAWTTTKTNIVHMMHRAAPIIGGAASAPINIKTVSISTLLTHRRNSNAAQKVF